MHIDGACHCGAIRYEAEIDPAKVIVCHCTDCQINSSSAFRWGVMVKKEDFKLVAGTLKHYVKVAESGAERSLTFCETCATSIYGSAVVDPQTYSLRLGTARQARELTPALQMWHRSALEWPQHPSDVPAVATQPANLK